MHLGHATPEGTARFAARAAVAAVGTAAGHFRVAPNGLTLSSLGMGTYLGNNDDATDKAVIAAAAASVAAGVNVLDTAINYRGQRAERSLGRLFTKLFVPNRVGRDEVFVSTKAGYVPYDGDPPADKAGYIRKTYIDSGIAAPADFVGGVQCIAPKFLLDQIGRSRANLGLGTIDLFYLHNPEYMIAPLGRPEWSRRIAAAFACLEDAVARGLIAGYGVATWDGFRVGPDRPEHLELAELLELASQAGGAGHHFRAVQLPISLPAPEAMRDATQTSAGKRVPLLTAAAEAGVAVFAGAPLLQGRALREVPADLAAKLPQLSDAQRALQWVRSLPGLTTALVGMKDRRHVAENLQLAAVPPGVA